MDEQEQTMLVATATEEREATAGGAEDELKAFLAAGGTFGMAIRDGLAQAQLAGQGAARMSSEHLANLLYGVGTVEHHTAPYSGRDYPNPRDHQDDKPR